MYLKSLFLDLPQKVFLSLPLKVQGVIWKTIACGCFAIMNILVRYLSGGAGEVAYPLSSAQLAFLQYLIGAFFFLPLFLKKETFETLKTGHVGMHLFRVISAAGGVVFLYYAFQVMPAAKAVSLGFTSPILTVVGAAWYLKEKMGPLRITGVTLGILGTFLITRPDAAFQGGASDFSDWALILPLVSSALFATSKILGRRLVVLGEAPQVLTTYILIFMAPVTLIPALIDWHPLTLGHWIYLIPLGIVATLGNLTHAYCYKCAEISFLAPFGFSRLVFTALLAFFLFNEWPQSEFLWIGSAIVFLGTVVICFKEESLRQKFRLLRPSKSTPSL